MEVQELHRRAVEAWQSKVEQVGADQWREPTPCTDWDVRALVNHVVGEELWTKPLADGLTIAEVGDRFDGDVLGSDPVAVARSAATEATEAVEAKVPEGVVVHLSFGATPIEEYVWQLTADHLIHGWDLAVATGQERGMDPDLVSAVAGWFSEREELYRQAGAIGPRGKTGADASSELLAAFGRDANR